MSSKGRSNTRVATDDAPLIATNDDAFQSKVAAMRAGYFRDAALAKMAEKYTAIHVNYGQFRRPPVINRGTYARVLLKETLVEAFLKRSGIHGKVPQIISLGAGFDTHPFALVKNASGVPPFHYVELDFPQVISEKTTIANEALCEKEKIISFAADKEAQGMDAVVKQHESVDLKECTDSMKAKSVQLKDGNLCIYSMRGVDLRDVKKLEAVLDDVALSSEAPTLILAEIVLVYMETEHSDALVSFFSKRFTGSRAFIVIEHTCRREDSEFGKQMVLNIAARGSPLLGLRSYPTMESQKERFKKLGWSFVKVESLLRAFEKRVVQRLALNKIEILDEVEEWSLIMSHYCIVCATEGDCAEQLLDWLDVGRYHDFGFRCYERDGSEAGAGVKMNVDV